MTTLEAKISPRATDLLARLDKVVGLIADLDLRRRDLAVAAASRPCASCRRRMWRIDQ